MTEGFYLGSVHIKHNRIKLSSVFKAEPAMGEINTKASKSLKMQDPSYFEPNDFYSNFFLIFLVYPFKVLKNHHSNCIC